MATHSNQEANASSGSSTLENKVARMADPNSDLATKYAYATEIRESMETSRDAEVTRVLPYLIPATVELLRSSQPSFHRDNTEYHFRRILLEIISRLPSSDVVRSNGNSLIQSMLSVIRLDNEENGVTACKNFVDTVRTCRGMLNEQVVNDLVVLLQECFGNMKGVIEEYLSEDSQPPDPSTILPALRSFKVLGELSMGMVVMSQANKPVPAAIQIISRAGFEFLSLQSPLQLKTKNDYEAMGNIWVGMAEGIKAPALYSDLIQAQIKMVSHLAYLMRYIPDLDPHHGESLVTNALRLMQDCPANGVMLRKELLVVFRHLLATPHRRALLLDVDKLMDERVLFGTGLATKELLRVMVYSGVSDLIHNIKGDLDFNQLSRIVRVYSALLFNSSLGFNMHILFSKVLFGLADPIVANKDLKKEAAKLLLSMFEACLERLEGLCAIQDEVTSALNRSRSAAASNTGPAGLRTSQASASKEEPIDGFFIEKSRPVGGTLFALEKPEDVFVECRQLYRALLHGFRVTLIAMKKVEAQPIEGMLAFRLFDSCIRCMALYDIDPRINEQNDIIDWLSHSILELDPAVFREVWTHRIEFFFENAQKRIILLNICQILFTREATSPALLAIVLKFLTQRLPQLGEYDEHTAVATIRLFKMSFNAVALHPVPNEPILASYLAKILMDSFPLAAKATKPTHYFHLLRALFRAIGIGGGRFELLYNAVLPLLPEMLESLNRQLLSSDGPTRDMIVELCLTVPLRLTHLLPHLSYLMQPLALALRGTPDLASQGLRTLELCIDNLTPDFLDPTLSIVLRELMEALFNHLKPAPQSHHLAHTTIRILGKLGGRNRRLLYKEPALIWHHSSDPAKMAISFSGNIESIALSPIAKLAVRQLPKLSPGDQIHAYSYLENCVSLFLYEGLAGKNVEEFFVQAVEGLFDCIHIPAIQNEAEGYIKKLAAAAFENEIRRNRLNPPLNRRQQGPLIAAFLDSIPHALSREQPAQMEHANKFVAVLLDDLVHMGPNVSQEELLGLLHHVGNRFTELCLDESWIHKNAGCNGIRMMADAGETGKKWIADRELDLIRTLLHVLKDLPFDLPRNVDDVMDLLVEVLTISHAHLDLSGDNDHAHTKRAHLAGMFFPELQSPNAIVRQAAQRCISYLVELSRRPAVDLLMPHRDRMLGGIFTKPLRALPFLKQIGMIEAVRFCVSLDPPLVELNDELLRLLHETLALADADDNQLLGPRSLRQSALEVVKLRVACIRLLTAAMPLTDYFSRQPQTRQRVTSVYFKSLYSPSQEVKDVAHDGLRLVLGHQSRLPKELLQTGLRPILMNLADPKKLSISGLEGLARLLELLTNYFKVEIGHKLLDHFRIVADPQQLQSNKVSISETEGIPKLVKLAHIFHLLPPAAGIFLESLVNAIVQAETTMRYSTRNPFSEPLGKYLDRFSSEGVKYLLQNLKLPRLVRTYRNILQARLAPNLERELGNNAQVLGSNLVVGTHPQELKSTLQLIEDMTNADTSFLSQHGFIVDQLVAFWNSIAPPALEGVDPHELNHWHSIIQDIFIQALQQSPRIDLLFELVSIYTRNLEVDTVSTTSFLYRHVALSGDIFFRRNVLVRFATWFHDEKYTWQHKCCFIRYIVTPTLLVQATRASRNDRIIDTDFIAQLHRLVWVPLATPDVSPGVDDTFRIELLHLTITLVQYYPDLLEDVKKDIVKYIWFHITSCDDVIVKQMGYLLAARFFCTFPTPPKFVLRAWIGLLQLPHAEVRASARYEALSILAACLPNDVDENGYLVWAKETRRILVDESNQTLPIYHLIVKQQDLFFPVRALFIQHMTSSLQKFGMAASASPESRVLSIELLTAIFKWEERAVKEAKQLADDGKPIPKHIQWRIPLALRETMVSYLMRLATASHEPALKANLVPRALSLLQSIVSPTGWPDVTIGLKYFSRALEQNDFSNEGALATAISNARVLQVAASHQPDSWYIANAGALSKLVMKGLLSDDSTLQDALYPIFDKLLGLFPLTDPPTAVDADIAEFHKAVQEIFVDNGFSTSRSNIRGVLLIAKSVIRTSPDHLAIVTSGGVGPAHPNNGEKFMKLFSELVKDHIRSAPGSPAHEANLRLLMMFLDICRDYASSLGDGRRWLLTALVALIDKSKSATLCKYILDMARFWMTNKSAAYPINKEKASLMQKLANFESRGDALFTPYLELVYDVYTNPDLRRTDVTSRLEASFMMGCKAKDSGLRERFMDLLDVSVSRSVFNRITYVLAVQSWEMLAEHNWIYIALHLLLGSADLQLSPNQDRRPTDVAPGIPRPEPQHIIRPLQRLLFLDPEAAHDVWVSVFPAVWASLSRREQADVTNHMINLLSKDYHIKQASLRPNVIQTLLAGIHGCFPPMTLPPHLVKYLAKTFGCWHVGIELLSSTLDHMKDDEKTVRAYVFDSLAEIYAELAEEDMFYGLWRRRSLHEVSNVALSFEQVGMWEQASSVYESAQNRVRTQQLAFNELEYCLWEDHWVLAAEKLQHWDILYEFAKNEGNQELMLESAWRTRDWSVEKDSLEEQINRLPEAATPRRRVFEAFISLLKMPAAVEKNVDFTRFLEDAMQLSLRKWVGLPQHFSVAHIPLLQHFQQFVELQEAVQIFGSLSQTNAQNLEKKSSELKMVLQAWRERLPNIYDDVNIWSDLVAWRQNVFNAINQAYMPLIGGANQSGATGAGNSNTYGYRGYHETAWIINRFAHVARKHGLLDVCQTFLTKIYTLPNIEISEAFLKLREQAKCHYQRPSDYNIGLDVINNTNLMFFSNAQKAEFHTLKAMFFAKLNRNEDANYAFGQAAQLDMNQAKGWAEWGRYHDKMFKADPINADYGSAASAVSCYMQAAGLYKSGKSRPLLARVLWLLSVDDLQGHVSRAFDNYKGDAAFWYWITFVPHLIVSLQHREAKHARYILQSLAKHYPQSVFYQLRTHREEMVLARRQLVYRAQTQAAMAEAAKRANPESNGDVTMADGTVEAPQPPAIPDFPPGFPRATFEHTEEVMQVLKTAFPLLILSLETMIDQINHKFKPSPEEDVYRNICMLMQDAIQNFMIRVNAQEDDGALNPNTTNMLSRMVANMPIFIRKEYQDDFITSKPTHSQYLSRLQNWREKFEKQIDAKPQFQPLVIISPYLTEFQYSKVDEIEVPGQYNEERDSGQPFVRIQKFAPKFETVRSNGSCWKRFTLYGNDHSKTSFIVQIPPHRHARREERLVQLLRTFNGALDRKKESRRRNLNFHLPAIVTCSPTARLFQIDASYISLNDIYDLHCEEFGISKEEPILFCGEKVKTVLRGFREYPPRQLTKTEYITLKKDIFEEINSKMVPETIITNYMIRTMDGPVELWRMRKQFTLQLAGCSFLTYVLSISSRTPNRFQVSRSNGLIAMTELLPGYAGISSQLPVFATGDVVPFRFTPNMQHFVGKTFTDGILAPSIMAIGQSLTEPEFDLDYSMCLFSRDEVSSWMLIRGKPWTPYEPVFRQSVNHNIENVVKKAEILACKNERETALQPGVVPTTTAIQTVTSQISTATNPLQLAKMGEMYYPWF